MGVVSFQRGLNFQTTPLPFLQLIETDRKNVCRGDLQSSEFTVGILGTRIELFVALDSNDLVQTALTPESPSKTDTDRSVSPRAFE